MVFFRREVHKINEKCTVIDMHGEINVDKEMCFIQCRSQGFLGWMSLPPGGQKQKMKQN